MAKKKKVFELPESTVIEVISTNGDKVYKKEMTYYEAKLIKKRKDFCIDFIKKDFPVIRM